MHVRRILLGLTLITTLLAPAAATAPAAVAGDNTLTQRAASKWVKRINDLVGDLPVGVQIGFNGHVLYRHKYWVARPPASNEKLLLSMALLNRLPAGTTIPTRVLATRAPKHGVVTGDLWIVGHGDPEVGQEDMQALAARIAASGVRKVRGRVLGATGPFARDWFAPGWRDYFPTYYCPIPTALTYRSNLDRHGRHIADPERRAATELTKQLRRAGVQVTKKPGSGVAPAKLTGLATIHSRPLASIMHRMDVWSKNFYAEVLGKYLGTRTGGPPGTIAKGAAAIDAYAKGHGVPGLVAHDGSGLSYRNRLTPAGMVHLLRVADAQPWGDTLRGSLARGGQGTLEDRLADVKVRAKTGTLISVSALSGWVWLRREGDWAEFSILSSGISKTQSIHIENAIVRVVSANATAA